MRIKSVRRTGEPQARTGSKQQAGHSNHDGSGRCSIGTSVVRRTRDSVQDASEYRSCPENTRPKPGETRGAPFGAGVEWLALEDRFAFYGGGIAFISAGGARGTAGVVAPTTPVHGSFSEDFRWVTLPDWPDGPIRCTDGQAAVFKSLWSFKGEPVTAEPVMQRADLDSDKPIDVFKVKARDKGKPEAEGPLAAYRALVVTQKRQGLYSMPEAATPTTASA